MWPEMQAAQPHLDELLQPVTLLHIRWVQLRVGYFTQLGALQMRLLKGEARGVASYGTEGCTAASSAPGQTWELLNSGVVRRTGSLQSGANKHGCTSTAERMLGVQVDARIDIRMHSVLKHYIHSTCVQLLPQASKVRRGAVCNLYPQHAPDGIQMVDLFVAMWVGHRR